MQSHVGGPRRSSRRQRRSVLRRLTDTEPLYIIDHVFEGGLLIVTDDAKVCFENTSDRKVHVLELFRLFAPMSLLHGCVNSFVTAIVCNDIILLIKCRRLIQWRSKLDGV